MSIKEFCRQLGGGFTVQVIDLEECLYTDFGNGFNVEISGYAGRHPLIMYLWFGDGLGAMIVDTFWKVPRTVEDVKAAVDMLREYSGDIIAAGLNTREGVLKMREVPRERSEYPVLRKRC